MEYVKPTNENSDGEILNENKFARLIEKSETI